jgi:DNA-binding NarL/FixJ family response regulator
MASFSEAWKGRANSQLDLGVSAMHKRTMKSGGTLPIRVQILHRNRIFRECLATILPSDGRFLVDQIDHNDPHLLTAIFAAPSQVVLIDQGLPDGIAMELTRRIHDCDSGVHVVLLTHETSQDDLVEYFAAGAHGCVPEDSCLQDLRDALAKVAAGEIFCSHVVVHSMFHRIAQKAREGANPGCAEASLTPRELEIVGLIADHLSNKQIARRLTVSLYTVKNHVHNIVEKLQVSGRYEAVDYARKRRWLDPTKVPSDTHPARG